MIPYDEVEPTSYHIRQLMKPMGNDPTTTITISSDAASVLVHSQSPFRYCRDLLRETLCDVLQGRVGHRDGLLPLIYAAEPALLTSRGTARRRPTQVLLDMPRVLESDYRISDEARGDGVLSHPVMSAGTEGDAGPSGRPGDGRRTDGIEHGATHYDTLIPWPDIAPMSVWERRTRHGLEVKLSTVKLSPSATRMDTILPVFER